MVRGSPDPGVSRSSFGGSRLRPRDRKKTTGPGHGRLPLRVAAGKGEDSEEPVFTLRRMGKGAVRPNRPLNVVSLHKIAL